MCVVYNGKFVYYCLAIVAELQDYFVSDITIATMWYLKGFIIYIVIDSSTVSLLADDSCYQNVEVIEWKSDPPPLPASIHYTDEENKEDFSIYVEHVKDDFNLTVYVNPYVDASTNCADVKPSNSRNLWKFFESGTFKKGIEPEKWVLPKALSGCYYMKLTDRAGKNDFRYFNYNFNNKSTPFYDWNLKTDCELEPLPGDEKTKPGVGFKLEIGLNCLEIEVQLFRQLKADVSHDEKELIGICSFTNQNSSCSFSRYGIGFNVIPLNNTLNTDKWITKVEWNNLPRDNANYSRKLKLMNGNCNMSYTDAMTWMPSYGPISFVNVVKSQHNNDSTRTHTLEPLPKQTKYIFGIVLGLSVAMVVIYWIRIWIKVFLLQRKNDNIPQLVEQGLEQVPFSDSDVLLMYAGNSPDLRKIIIHYRNRLREKYHHRVHDIYSITESTMLENLGVTGWIEKMMKANNKFIWFDTPELRSYFKKDVIAKDHRDMVIPYAVTLTKTVFQNTTTQYKYHFVVRLEGLDVTDGKDDPLLLISPGTRYHLPHNFDALCTDLTE